MAHKVLFFNFDRWGEGKDYVEANQKLKAAGVEVAFSEGTLNAASAATMAGLTTGPSAGFDIAGVFMD